MSEIKYTPPTSGGGGQNPTTNFIPLNNGTSSFVDSSIYNDLSNVLIQTILGGNLGFSLDANSNQYIVGQYDNVAGLFIDLNHSVYSLGDIDNNANYITYNGSTFKSVYGGSEIGLKLDFFHKEYIFGDLNNNYYLHIYDYDGIGTGGFVLFLADAQFGQGNQYIGINAEEGFIAGATAFDFYTLQNGSINFNSFGNLNVLSTNNNSNMLFDDNSKTILLNTNNTATSFLIDGASDKLTFTTGALNFVGAALQDGATVVPVGKNLVITLNGTQYHIPLYN